METSLLELLTEERRFVREINASLQGIERCKGYLSDPVIKDMPSRIKIFEDMMALDQQDYEKYSADLKEIRIEIKAYFDNCKTFKEE